MGMRRDAREKVIQFLYYKESVPDYSPDQTLTYFWESQETKSETQKFATRLIHGVLEKQNEIDHKIEALSKHWDFNRIAPIDRNILRLAFYEMLFCDDIPPVVSINEAIEIAKKFSTEESGKFVNGFLDVLRKDLPRPARQSAGK
jgi:N utilization substance protein B